jgi:hypothetical protein
MILTAFLFVSTVLAVTSFETMDLALKVQVFSSVSYLSAAVIVILVWIAAVSFLKRTFSKPQY